MPKHSISWPTPENTNWLAVEDFEQLCFDLAREFLTFKEPIPDYPTRDNNLLDSALGSPRQTFNRRLLYPTLPKQAAILFYALIKNHPFKNGNKRVAVMALLAFLHINKFWISVAPFDLYKLACEISESKSEEKDKSLIKIKDFITDYLVDLKN